MIAVYFLDTCMERVIFNLSSSLDKWSTCTDKQQFWLTTMQYYFLPFNITISYKISEKTARHAWFDEVTSNTFCADAQFICYVNNFVRQATVLFINVCLKARR